jgi:hypothetical protein
MRNHGVVIVAALLALVVQPAQAQLRTQTIPQLTAPHGTGFGSTGTGTSTPDTTLTIKPGALESTLGKIPSAPQVQEPPPPLAAPASADSGISDCQCYRIENVPQFDSSGNHVSYIQNRVPNGRSTTCCPR